MDGGLPFCLGAEVGDNCCPAGCWFEENADRSLSTAFCDPCVSGAGISGASAAASTQDGLLDGVERDWFADSATSLATPTISFGICVCVAPGRVAKADVGICALADTPSAARVGVTVDDVDTVVGALPDVSPTMCCMDWAGAVAS